MAPFVDPSEVGGHEAKHDDGHTTDYGHVVDSDGDTDTEIVRDEEDHEQNDIDTVSDQDNRHSEDDTAEGGEKQEQGGTDDEADDDGDPFSVTSILTQQGPTPSKPISTLARDPAPEKGRRPRSRQGYSNPSPKTRGQKKALAAKPGL